MGLHESFVGCLMMVWASSCITFSGADDYCSLSQFSCLSGSCIPSQWVCDEEDDCKDNSDETDCAPRLCNERDELRCASGQCILARWWCDGEPDCSDGSDESECTHVQCKAGYFSCGIGGPCISMAWKCDGHEDCKSGLDESPETCGAVSCKPGEFLCDQSKRCITARWKCDLDQDCEDGSDEADCQPTNCSSSHFQCDNGHCIPRSWQCDGDFDCRDHSDERNCTSVERRPSSGKHCSATEFQCSNGECIHSAWACDSESDCTDSSDEIGCQRRTECLPDEFECTKSFQCIARHALCNGIQECSDGSDEQGCAVVPLCDIHTSFQCSDGNETLCINVSQVCDKHADCPGMQDEAPELCRNTSNPCLVNNGGCSHQCVFNYVSHFCTCPHGYQLDSTGLECEDIDECLVADTCSQICENKKGSYKCSCRMGYEWDQVDQSCRATGEEPFLLFANRHDLRQLQVYSGSYHMLVGDLKSVIALDFDFADRILFWSDVALETISMTRLSQNHSQGVDVLVKHDLSTPDGLAFDWIHKNLYWTDTGSNRIDVLYLSTALEKSSARHAMRKMLINAELDEPRAIVVDPRTDQRFLYWTDWGNNPKIERSYLDGTSRTQLITTDLQWPNGLTIDYDSNSLFWVDAKLHQISCSDLNGANQRVIMTSYQHLKHPFAVAVFEDHVYWSDWETESIFKVHKSVDKKGRNGVESIAVRLHAPMDIHIYHRLKQPRAINACIKSECSHICLPRPENRGGYTCLCPDHQSIKYELDPDLKTCRAVGITPGHVEGSSSEPQSTPLSSSMQQSTRHSRLSAGHTAGLVVALLLIIAIVFVVVGYIAYRYYLHKSSQQFNFDNPIYCKSTEDQLTLEKQTQQPSWPRHATLEPLTSPPDSEFV